MGRRHTLTQQANCRQTALRRPSAQKAGGEQQAQTGHDRRYLKLREVPA
jgi:hypothetical protein